MKTIYILKHIVKDNSSAFHATKMKTAYFSSAREVRKYIYTNAAFFSPADYVDVEIRELNTNKLLGYESLDLFPSLHTEAV